MDINNELKEVIKREVLIKKLSEKAEAQESVTRRRIEAIKDFYHLQKLKELEC